MCCTKTVHNPVVMRLRAMTALTSAVTLDKPGARVRNSRVSWWSATGSGMRSFRDLRQTHFDERMSDGWLKRTEDTPPQSGRLDRVSVRAAELAAATPFGHRVWRAG